MLKRDKAASHSSLSSGMSGSESFHHRNFAMPPCSPSCNLVDFFPQFECGNSLAHVARFAEAEDTRLCFYPRTLYYGSQWLSDGLEFHRVIVTPLAAVRNSIYAVLARRSYGSWEAACPRSCVYIECRFQACSACF